jgi:zinc protease
MSLIDKPEEMFLSNGIPVILQHSDSPVGTLHWWNLTGSTDERPDEAGFAHFLEHMLFKDAGAKETGAASTGKTARIIESLGGEINAYTTFDQTVYHVTCSEQYWEKVIDQFCIMAKPQKFLNEDFLREREVILEELRRGEDSPDRQLYQELFKLTYKKHPYGRPVIGFEKVLKAANVKKLESYYQRNYVSSRMGIVLVGPIKDKSGARKKKLLSILEKRFGKSVIPKRTGAPQIRAEEKPKQSPRFLAKHFDIKVPEVAISFRIPDLMHADTPFLEVLAAVLGSGESSRLYQKMFYQESLVTDVSTSVYVPKDAGMFLVSAELKKTSDLEAFARSLVDEMKRIASGDIRKEELDRVITNLESDKLYSTQTVDGIAGRLGFLRFSLGDLRFDSEYLDQIKTVSASTLQRLAKEYLTEDRMSLVVFQPEGEERYDFNQIKSVFSELKPAESRGVKSLKKSVGLEPEIFTTASGLQVSYFERPGTPVYSIYASAFGGTRSELLLDPANWGGSHLLSQTWAKGTPNHNSKELSEIIEGSAASIDGFSGRNTIGLQSTGLVRDWDKLSSLFLEILMQPTFAEEELSHAKRVTLDAIRSIPDHSSQVCSKLFMEQLFSDHPYGKSLMGDEAQVERLSSSDLKRLHATFINPKNMSLSIVGGTPRTEVEQWLNRLDRELANQTSRFHQGLIPSPGKMNGPRWAAANFDREQTHILVGGHGIPMYLPERFALRILQNILGGQSGRMFIELREKRSMAYTVSPTSMEGLETGYVGTYIACAPEKKDEAIAGIRQVIETLVKKGPTPAEMIRAKNYYLGQRAMDLQSTWSLAGAYGLELLYRNENTPEAEIRKQIERVSAKQVRDICEKLLLNAPQLTVVVS